MAKRFCTGCGTEVTGLFCSKCGKEIDDFQKDKEFLTKQAQERIINESANSGTTNYNPMPTSPYYGSNAEDNLKSFRIVGAGLIIAFAIFTFVSMIATYFSQFFDYVDSYNAFSSLIGTKITIFPFIIIMLLHIVLSVVAIFMILKSDRFEIMGIIFSVAFIVFIILMAIIALAIESEASFGNSGMLSLFIGAVCYISSALLRIIFLIGAIVMFIIAMNKRNKTMI